MTALAPTPGPLVRPAGTPGPDSSALRAVLAAGCDGYPGGTPGTIEGQHDGCVWFRPDHPERVARWAVPRERLLVPASLLHRR